ncbi:MAG TPA: LysM peptidoglycan-binding domain-containing protein [Candidatus Limnocylindrales bacterium]|nr:LysM peptidoglycan-binding domain-containing protein [Candidatus Limnocylindrales bacterium]
MIASALFTVACAAVAITFVAGRGGLQLPVAPAASHAALASPGASLAPTVMPATAPPPSLVPTASPGAATSSPPSPTPTAGTTLPPTTEPVDPLTALPGCLDHPGCYEYTVQRGDTLSVVASRYRIPVLTLRALNPELDAAGTIVVGHVLYLGRDPWVRLDACGGDAIDCYLYVVRPGDGLSTIAARFGLTVDAILAANPAIPDANTIYSGQVIRLQYQHAVI